MEFGFEIERLRHNILEKKFGDDSIIELEIDSKLVITPEIYYFTILKQLYYLLLNDNLKLTVTNFDIFKKYWRLSKKYPIKYNCWISKISDAEKNKLLEVPKVGLSQGSSHLSPGSSHLSPDDFNESPQLSKSRGSGGISKLFACCFA